MQTQKMSANPDPRRFFTLNGKSCEKVVKLVLVLIIHRYCKDSNILAVILIIFIPSRGPKDTPACVPNFIFAVFSKLRLGAKSVNLVAENGGENTFFSTKGGRHIVGGNL
jgi:hypothetical protein